MGIIIRSTSIGVSKTFVVVDVVGTSVVGFVVGYGVGFIVGFIVGYVVVSDVVALINFVVDAG